jgi:trans-2,3-dihydro-3-hydroxyanthranilate isomerase
MTRRRFRLVNVFVPSGSRLAGNALCVFEDATGLDTETMQALALQMNLSETTFIAPRDADGTTPVRIFTPSFEMPFAGHPTLGTAHVVRALTACGDDVRLRMKVGIVPVRAAGDRWTLETAQGPAVRAPSASRAELAAMLRLRETDLAEDKPPSWIDTGSDQLVIPLATVDAVERCAPDAELVARFGSNRTRLGLAYVWAFEDSERVRARFFFLKHGSLVEDPGTGSACANLGGWFVAHDARLPIALTISQGTQVGRPCEIGLRVDEAKRIFVSGAVVELAQGELTL